MFPPTLTRYDRGMANEALQEALAALIVAFTHLEEKPAIRSELSKLQERVGELLKEVQIAEVR